MLTELFVAVGCTMHGETSHGVTRVAEGADPD
jgi:hypothetical protein